MREEREFPLRLLDIRRIDLHSSGWETFYVKRAVDDWLRDSSNNLGEYCSLSLPLGRFAARTNHNQPADRQQTTTPQTTQDW